MMIGYARTSTLEQKASIEAQTDSLKAIGCDRLQRANIVRSHQKGAQGCYELCP